MIARDVIVATLEPLKAQGIAVEPYSRNITAPQKPTVMVRVDEIQPGPTTRGWHVIGVLLVIEPQTEPGAADDELEAVTADVLAELDTADIAARLRWTTAKRVVFKAGEADDSPTFPAFEVAVECYTDPDQE